MRAQDFLLEIGVEEIPDWMIAGALADLRRLFLGVLEKSQLHQGVEISTHATPRRLVLFAKQVPEKQPDSKEIVTGPPASAPEQAVAGFARKMGAEIGQLKKISTGKGEYYSYTRRLKGRRAVDLLGEALPAVILGISWPKSMTWTGKSGPRFIRPIRWLLALYGGRVVPFELGGVRSDRYTYGHRRLAVERRIRAADFGSFREGLRKNYVLLDAAERRQSIQQGVRRLLGGEQNGLRLRPNEKLLETLVNLTEWPAPILGGFDPEFLSLPEEVLVTVMQHHQKYFSVEDSQRRLAPHFIAVMNLDADPQGFIRHGHERVLRARFNDARFFWETDQKKPLRDRLEDLKHVTFYKDWTYWDKTERNRNLLVNVFGGGELALRANQLAKCDLTTELVKEFTELQGIVGGLYARAQGEPEEVALAIYDHYQPVPRTETGRVVALADRVETLQSFFGIGLMPTGSKDPFALRRTALSVVRILVEGRRQDRLSRLFEPPEWREFILDRARYYFREMRGYRYDEVNAVLAAGSENLADAAGRLEALHQVRPTENFEPLATSFKRIKNILIQAGGMECFGSSFDPASLEPGPEQELYAGFQRVAPEVRGLKNERRYLEALIAIASLRPKVDLFFDKVLVNAPDERIRANRLNFLAQLLREFSTIADFSEIVISGEQHS
ncbi:MAG TPA: glycine--tRNA ligase subunit beta [Bryobacterales bacterium]|jgi:glycyl-tRNA synthetase beta chain|nr:glycine--tRNA ligase subunit beta [Bryobacterales bacterium]